MKNELEESWNKYKEKAPHMTTFPFDRYNFQAGFNAAFKLFGKTNITNQSSGQEKVDTISAEDHWWLGRA